MGSNEITTGITRTAPPLELVSAPPRATTDRAEEHKNRSRLRRRLVLLDAVTVAAAWIGATYLGPSLGLSALPALLLALGSAAVTLGVIALVGLHRARICALRRNETIRLARACLIAGVAHAGVVSLLLTHGSVTAASITGGATNLVALLGSRAVYRNWLLSQRAAGRYHRRVAVIGADDEAARLSAHLEERPEVGYQVVGFFRSERGHATHLARPVLGRASDAPEILQELGISGAVVVPGALTGTERDVVLAGLLDAKLHVHLATGLRGVDSRRIRSLPMGREPLMYLEPAGVNAPWYRALQRGIDIVGASAALLFAAPVLGLSALAIRLSDGGPVIFRQQRVGKDLRPFGLLKLRSMVVDAEARLPALLEANERTGGPLFKLDDDPRVTRVGRFIRATSIDELPQLVNVLKGEMSLVGPRPALPSEVASFDEATLVRQQVRPGVTGLWQVEARDNPSFTSYQYFDTFYVENQSLALDCAILIATARAVWRSFLRAVSPRRRAEVEEVVDSPGPARNRRAPMFPRVNVAGVEFDSLDFAQATDAIVKLAKDGRRHHVVTGNVDHLMLLRVDPVFRKSYELASLRLADGTPIVWLSKLIGTPLPERVTGSDLFPMVCARAEAEGLSVGFLGGREDAIPRAMARLKLDYPNLRVAGFHCPPRGFEDDPEQAAAAIAAVNQMQPDLLFVCLGAPKQEHWWAWNFPNVQPTVALHFGASLDFYAGVVQRAPEAFQRLGMEWLYRVLREPGRMWKRYLVRDMRFLAVMARVTLQARLMPRSGRHLRHPN